MPESMERTLPPGQAEASSSTPGEVGEGSNMKRGSRLKTKAAMEKLNTASGRNMAVLQTTQGRSKRAKHPRQESTSRHSGALET